MKWHDSVKKCLLLITSSLSKIFGISLFHLCLLCVSYIVIQSECPLCTYQSLKNLTDFGKIAIFACLRFLRGFNSLQLSFVIYFHKNCLMCECRHRLFFFQKKGNLGHCLLLISCYNPFNHVRGFSCDVDQP